MAISKRNILIGSIIIIFLLVEMQALAAGSVATDKNVSIRYYNGEPYVDYSGYYNSDGNWVMTKKPIKRYRHNTHPYIPKNSIITNQGQFIRNYQNTNKPAKITP